MDPEEIKTSEETEVLEEKEPKKIRPLNILLITFGIILLIGWFLIKSLAGVMPLTKLLWPLVIGAIILGIAFVIWKWFAEQAKALWGIDLFRKISQTVLLTGLAYLPFFYFSYGWLVPKLMKNIGFSYYHTLEIVTALQLPIAGILYFFVSPIWPEKGKIMRGFLIVSLIGPLIIAYMMYQNPYRFFDHQTGTNKIWVSDSEKRIYYSPGYGVEDGKPLRPGTAADAEKFKEKEMSFRDRLNKKFGAGPEKEGQGKSVRRLSGIFKLPKDGTKVTKDINGHEYSHLEGERGYFRQLGPTGQFTVLNKKISSLVIDQPIYTTGPAISDGKVELMATGGKDVIVELKILPPRS